MPLKTPTSPLTLTESLRPADEAEVCQIIRGAAETGTPVYPIGGGTMLRYGAASAQPGIGLSLDRLGRVIDYPARDLTITAGAGITIAELARQLSKKGQRLPVDVPLPDRATLGGVVATSPAGPRRYGWGTMRDYVIGLRAVDGQGTPYNGGGRVVKNAAGYDLCRLLTGSLGTLGVIIQVTLMVKPLPQKSALVACAPADLDTTERLLADLADSGARPVAVEWLVGPAWLGVAELAELPNQGAGYLVVGLEGTAAEVDWMVDQVLRPWENVGAISTQTVRDSGAVRLWRTLTDFPAAAASDGAGPVLVEIRILPSSVADMVRCLIDWDSQCSIQAHAGDGVLRVRFSLDPPQVQAVLVERLRPNVAACGGSAVVLSYPDGVGWDCRMVWGPPGDGAAVMQALKRQFDTHGILNPGRFIY